jgi:4-hydroxythreonine-4-phosphate dehydrogenase
MSKPVIGISVGDINGIGTEVILKTCKEHEILNLCTPVIYANGKLISAWRKILNFDNINYTTVKPSERFNLNAINLVQCWEEDAPVQPGQLNEAGGKYALKSLEACVNDVINKKTDAIVTGPIHKKNIYSEIFPFRGHTDYLAKRDGKENQLMILCSETLRVALVTGHIPLQEVAAKITRDFILQKIKNLHDSLVKDFMIQQPRIAVLGLNPHAGDEGLIGKEDQEQILPACKMVRQQNNILAYGPYPADAFFGMETFKKFDGVLAMYHDQGLIPFKLLHFSSGVNFTAGLSFVRTSPDHGTAFDIAGKNKADENSFRASIFCAIDIFRNRAQYAEMTSNPIKRAEMAAERN